MTIEKAFLKEPSINLSRVPIAAHYSYHQNVYLLLKMYELDKREETAGLLVAYMSTIDDQQKYLAYQRSLMKTDEVKSVAEECKCNYSFIVSTMRNLSNRAVDVTDIRLKHIGQLMHPYSLRSCRASEPERLTIYRSLVATMREECSREMELCGLIETVNALAEGAAKLEKLSMERIEESVNQFRGDAKRLRSEMDDLYRRLMSFVVAWGNGRCWSNPELQNFFDEMHQLLLACIELASETRDKDKKE